MCEKTICQNLGLYHAAHARQLRQIRREEQQAHRRHWWLRIFKGRRDPDYFVLHFKSEEADKNEFR
jgi:hypothetical protein